MCISFFILCLFVCTDDLDRVNIGSLFFGFLRLCEYYDANVLPVDWLDIQKHIGMQSQKPEVENSLLQMNFKRQMNH